MNGNNIDPRLRDALRGMADDAPAGDELWEKTEHRIAVHRRRRTIGSGLASACAVVAVALGIVAIARETNDVNVANPPVTSTTNVSSEDTEGVIDPAERVVARLDGRIAIVDDEWKPIRTIARVGPQRFVRQLAIAPDGKTLYYLIDAEPGPFGSDCATLLAVDVETGDERRIADARTFALTADGEHIALGMHADDSRTCQGLQAGGEATIRVVNAATGRLVWQWSSDELGASYVESLAWSPQDDRVATEVCDVTCQVLVVTGPGSHTGPFAPVAPADQTVSLAWGPDGLWSLQVCCREPEADSDTRLRLVALDPVIGAAQALYVFDGQLPANETELVALGPEWYLLRRTGIAAGVESELSRLDLTAEQVVEGAVESVTAIAERSR